MYTTEQKRIFYTIGVIIFNITIITKQKSNSIHKDDEESDMHDVHGT